MAFQTNTMVNGQWTATTMDASTVLRHLDEQEQLPESVPTAALPVRGLLSQTVIPSPVVHWILPARLRTTELNDVAFIGNDFIQVRELRFDDVDDHLCDIVRKEGFGSRIRNARVFRPWTKMKPVTEKLDNYLPWRNYQQDESSRQERHRFLYALGRFDPDYVKAEASLTDAVDLPPEGIVLLMQTGQIIFLMLDQSMANLTFMSGRYRVSKPMLDFHPGTHLTIDPSSRYMAVGCYQQVFTVYAIQSRSALSQQCSSDPHNRKMRFIGSERIIYVPGVILKMEFLYPSRDDEDHIILLVITSRKGRSRMLIYEWNAGDDLRKVKPHGERGHLLGDCHQTPLLLIPLKFEAAFILVFEQSMAVCRGILAGPPLIEEFNTQPTGRTPVYHGRGEPLWTAWSRPARINPGHLREKDDIYIAREDGLIKYLELDEDDFVTGDVNVAQCTCSIGIAFTSLDWSNMHKQKTGDLLLCAGGAGVGGTFLHVAKTDRGRIEDIHNWSPAQDFIIVSKNRDAPISSRFHGVEKVEPDTLFACVGKGIQSAIVELRHGLEARLGLHSVYTVGIDQAWVIPPNSSLTDDCNLFLLSLPTSSALLKLSNDAKEIDEVGQEATSFDLHSRTITANTYGDVAIQVTEQSILYVKGSNVETLFGAEDMLREGQFITNAIIYEDVVLFATYCGPSITSLRTVERRIDPVADSMDTSEYRGDRTLRFLHDFNVSVTALAMCRILANQYVIVAVDHGQNQITLHFVTSTINGQVEQRSFDVPNVYNGAEVPLQRIVSLVIASTSSGVIGLLCGTQNGLVIALFLLISDDTITAQSAHCALFGNTAAILTQDDISRSRVFVVCDAKVYSISMRSFHSKKSIPSSTQETNRIWITEIHTPDLLQPTVTAIARLGPTLSAGTEGGLLLISDENILLVGLNHQAKVIPRYLSIPGTPSRIIYSERLGVFIVGACVAGKSTLLFIDPDNGKDLSRPVIDKMGLDLPYISGLGNSNELILELFEWYFIKEDKAWHFIIVGTDGGSLLLVSTARTEEEIEEPTAVEDSINPPTAVHVRCWKKYRVKTKGPLCSAVGCNDGIVYSAGNKLYYEGLDTQQKKFVTIATHRLPSRVISLSVDGGTLYALTLEHSMRMLKLPTKENPSFEVTHGDWRNRSGLHNLIGKSTNTENRIHLLSDKLHNVAGIWPSKESVPESLQPIFETQLPYSILRFRSGYTTPVWNSRWAGPERAEELGIVDITGKHAEVLGIALDGSICSFSVLDERAWLFLRFLYNRALKSPRICEFTHDEISLNQYTVKEPNQTMHIDGDILRRVLETRAMEELVDVDEIENERPEEASLSLVDLLHDLHGNSLERGLPWHDYIMRAYADLEYYLRPVM